MRDPIGNFIAWGKLDHCRLCLGVGLFLNFLTRSLYTLLLVEREICMLRSDVALDLLSACPKSSALKCSDESAVMDRCGTFISHTRELHGWFPSPRKR